jgi:hypothetical protein
MTGTHMPPKIFFSSYSPRGPLSSHPVTAPPCVDDEMSPSVATIEIDSAYGHFRRGFTWGITLGIRLGILLERHPISPAKTPVSGPVGGSAGIPDSPGHKPVKTSGPAGGRLAFPTWVRSLLPFDVIGPALIPASLSFSKFSSIYYLCAASFQLSSVTLAPSLASLTCGNAAAFRSEMQPGARD